MPAKIETTGQLLDLLRKHKRLPSRLDTGTVAIIESCRKRLGRRASLVKLADLIESHACQAMGLARAKVSDVPVVRLSRLLLIERDTNPTEDAHIVHEPTDQGIEIRLSDQAVASHGLLLNQIILGPRPGFGNKFPISDFDATIVDGDTPSICPKTDRPEAKDWLPTILEVFKSHGLVKPGKTIHWVGSQSKLENFCTCFRSDIQSKSTADAPQKPVAQFGTIQLFGQGEEILIDGKPAGKLTNPQYNVIQALIHAGSAGLTKDGLVVKSGHVDAIGILKRVTLKSGKWKSVIAMAEITNGRYRIK